MRAYLFSFLAFAAAGGVLSALAEHFGTVGKYVRLAVTLGILLTALIPVFSLLSSGSGIPDPSLNPSALSMSEGPEEIIANTAAEELEKEVTAMLTAKYSVPGDRMCVEVVLEKQNGEYAIGHVTVILLSRTDRILGDKIRNFLEEELMAPCTLTWGWQQ